MDELADEGAELLGNGLKSADWERVRDRFAEWFALRGQDDYVDELRSLKGPLGTGTQLGKLSWHIRLSEGLADAWDVDGSEELTALIREFDVPAPAAAAPVAPGIASTSKGSPSTDSSSVCSTSSRRTGTRRAPLRTRRQRTGRRRRTWSRWRTGRGRPGGATGCRN